MTETRQPARRPSRPAAAPGRDIGGTLALMGLRVVLLGCAFALVGVLGHVAMKVATAA